MEQLIDNKTKAILINNPSNPCGSCFDHDHLREIANLARKYQLPIIADEIYGHCVFKGSFIPMHTVSEDVPIISVGGLAKEFIVPGWRVGWIILHDQGTGRLAEYKTGLKRLTQLILGANSLVQCCLPQLLTPQPNSPEEQSLQAFSTQYMNILRTNAEICMEEAKKIPELTVIEPQGAMYLMIGIDFTLLHGFKDDTDFSRRLLEEENLFVLPGQCFQMPNFIRLVICPPKEIILEAFQRLQIFCEKYRKPQMLSDEINQQHLLPESENKINNP